MTLEARSARECNILTGCSSCGRAQTCPHCAGQNRQITIAAVHWYLHNDVCNVCSAAACGMMSVMVWQTRTGQVMVWQDRIGLSCLHV